MNARYLAVLVVAVGLLARLWIAWGFAAAIATTAGALALSVVIGVAVNRRKAASRK